ASVGPLVPQSEVPALLPRLARELGQHRPKESVIEKPAQILTFGNEKAVFEQLKLREGREMVYVFFVGERITHLAIYSRLDLPETWKDVPDRVATSLRTESAGQSPTQSASVPREDSPRLQETGRAAEDFHDRMKRAREQAEAGRYDEATSAYQDLLRMN